MTTLALLLLLWQAPASVGMEISMIDSLHTQGEYTDPQGRRCVADTALVNNLQVTWNYCQAGNEIPPSPWRPWYIVRMVFAPVPANQ